MGNKTGNKTRAEQFIETEGGMPGPGSGHGSHLQFLRLSTVDILGGIILCHGAGVVLCVGRY